MDIELWFSKRCIKFLKMAMNSKNEVVRMITNMGVNGLHSIIGGNFRVMKARYDMDVSNVFKMWKDKCDEESEHIRISEQINELCGWRDRCHESFLSRSDCKTMIDFLCTG